MNKIKVLHIGKYYYPYKGGLESCLYTLVNELKDKVQMQILVANTNPKTVIEKDGDLSVIRMASFGSLFSQPLTPTLLFWMKRLNADIIHLHFPNPLAMICYLILKPKGKLIISYHSDIVKQRIAMIILKPFLKKLLQKADKVVVTSENLINSSAILKDFSYKCCIIPHGVDISKFGSTANIKEEAEKIRSSINKPILLFVGRLTYYKGLEYLISAMRDIKAHLIIIGEGGLKSRLQQLAAILKVSDKVSWLGGVSEESLPFYYHACDIFVLPSCYESESFGIVILEAHAASKPVVSTNLPTGVSFINLHQKTGLVVPFKDPSALSSAINRLLESSQLRQELGRNGNLRVKKEFTKEIMGKKHLTVYNTIVNN